MSFHILMTGGFLPQRASTVKIWCFSLLSAWTNWWIKIQVVGDFYMAQHPYDITVVTTWCLNWIVSLDWKGTKVIAFSLKPLKSVTLPPPVTTGQSFQNISVLVYKSSKSDLCRAPPSHKWTVMKVSLIPVLHKSAMDPLCWLVLNWSGLYAHFLTQTLPIVPHNGPGWDNWRMLALVGIKRDVQYFV